MSGKGMQVMETFKSDVTKATWRTVAKQIPKAARVTLLKFMKAKKAKPSWIKAATEMLETESGRAGLSLVLGWSFKFMPHLKDDPTAIKLAEEWRVDAMATFGDEIFNELFAQLAPVLMMINDVPKLRIEDLGANVTEALKNAEAVMPVEEEEAAKEVKAKKKMLSNS